jgi:transcriptional regulator with XRE-family HTH domain
VTSAAAFTLDGFGERVRSAREAMGLSQKQLSPLVGLDYSMIAHIEAGRRSPSIAALCRLADGLGMSVDALLGRTAA